MHLLSVVMGAETSDLKGKKDNIDLVLKDVTVTQNIDKANYFDYLKKNLKILTTGF